MTNPGVFAAGRTLGPRDLAELLAAESLDHALAENEIKALWVGEAARRAQGIIDGTAERSRVTT